MQCCDQGTSCRDRGRGRGSRVRDRDRGRGSENSASRLPRGTTSLL